MLADATPPIAAAEMEDLLAPAIEAAAMVGTEPEALQRFAQAWDRGAVPPSALLPEPGRIGSASVQAETGLSTECLAFLACASLRPILEEYFAECRPHLGRHHGWELGVCPFCGAPAAFADLLEDGQRHLACHLCGGGWSFSRLRCPHCGARDARDFVRLLAEEQEEGYAIFACKGCHGYVKELDRRLRWNAGAALVEDWGTPHLDVVARRAEYWRAVPTLIDLESAGAQPH